MNKQQEAVRKLAEDTGTELRESYSGRFMYGKICMGIVCDKSDYEDVLERAVKLGLKNHRTDNMGLRMIIYFPDVEGLGGREEDE